MTMHREDPTTGATDPHVYRVLKLMRKVGELDARLDIEPSFKAVRGRLLRNRFLLGISRREGDEDADRQITLICHEIGMPHEFQDAFACAMPEANHVYFGVEGDGESLVLKAYLEFRDRIEQEIGASHAAGRDFLLFKGFKWDALSPRRQAISDYRWHPHLEASDLIERLRALIDPGEHSALISAFDAFVRRACATLSARHIQYLEVTEAGNPRRSFDINVYKAGLRVADLYADLSAAMRHYGIPAETFRALHERIKSERLGHLAGGVDRQDDDFLTIYYGGRQIDSSQLRSATIAGAGDTRGEG